MKTAYVYYRVDPGQTARAARQIDALLAAMAARCSRPPRRASRCDDPMTWMEIYEGIDEAFAAALTTAVDRSDWESFTLGERHLEWFCEAGATAEKPGGGSA